ncbi:MAG: hypothetical protein J1E83_10790 [Lachnospiraceae bacterium]|nr:hypothetical protein [Lachnospiraceae bacterium]
MAKEVNAAAEEKKKLQNEKKKLKSEQKEQKKLAKKRAKEIAAQEAELAEDEEGGGFFTFLATLAIIAVWIAILCVVIKLDVGGFGSNVLTPVLKDIPVVNKILPTPAQQEAPADEDNGEYANIGEATEQIKSLELQLQDAQSQNLAQQEEIANLRATVARLEGFEDKQVEFQRIQTEFFRDVVYAENGPGLEEYVKYYEAMEPTTAEYIYRQVITQLQKDSEIQEYAATYTGMKPKQAAAIFEAMQDDLNLVARILQAMTPEERGAILENMSPDVAAKLTKIMNPES